jgi:hypothetical protein
MDIGLVFTTIQRILLHRGWFSAPALYLNKMSEDSSFDFSLEDIPDNVIISAVFSQPTLLITPPVFVKQVQADDVDSMDFSSEEASIDEADKDEETATATPARPSQISPKHKPVLVKSRLPVVNKDTISAVTYDIEFTLDRRIQKDAAALHKFHNSYYHTTLVHHRQNCREMQRLKRRN